MGERKVLNKYYPPDFDPALIPKATRPKNNQVKVRMMLPMSVRCQICGEYLYRGKKFNARKETVDGEDYLGIKVFRFYLKCTRCSGEFTIKTDPRNSDYACEQGASRNFEPWRDKDDQIEAIKAKREEEERGDAMKSLENRTADSRLEMDILDALEDVKSINARNAKVDIDSLLERKRQLDEAARKQQEDLLKISEDDEELVQRLFHSRNSSIVKRLADAIEEEILEDEEDDQEAPLPILVPAPLPKQNVAPPSTKPPTNTTAATATAQRGATAAATLTPTATTNNKKRPLSSLMPGLVTVKAVKKEGGSSSGTTSKATVTISSASSASGPSAPKRIKTETTTTTPSAKVVLVAGGDGDDDGDEEASGLGGLVAYD